MGNLTHSLGSSVRVITSGSEPVITVADNTVLNQGDIFTAPVGVATKWNNNNIPYVVDSSAVDMSTLGTYKITYTATDLLGRVTVEERNIIVEEGYREITVANYGKFIEDPLSNFDLFDELNGGITGNGQETYTLEGTNPLGYKIVWYSNPNNVNFNGLLDSTNPTWVIYFDNSSGTGTHVDFSGGSSDYANGSIAVPSSDITITG